MSSFMRQRLHLESLEGRTLPAVNVAATINGISFADDSRYEPPDTDVAVGPSYVVETVNDSVALFDRASGQRLYLVKLNNFFSPLGNTTTLGDPVVTYDELTGQFVLGVLDYPSGYDRFDVAVTNDADPLDGWTLARYDTLHDGTTGSYFADYPKVGYNADAWVFSLNMIHGGFTGFNHVDTLSIDKSDLTGYLQVVPGAEANSTLAPATMHGANPGDPMWLVETNTATSLTVVKMTDVLSDSPTYTFTDVPVAFYGIPPNAPQPGGGSINVSQIGNRIMNAVMRNGQLLTDHTVAVGSAAAVRWYQIDTTGATPVVVQTGTINQGPGVYTYYPAIEVNSQGDLGLTFMESSATEYGSMYVTGRSASDPAGTLQTPVLAWAGSNRYTGTRAGDYSGISVDPTDGVSFWAANEYMGTPLWDTGIATFGVSPAGTSSALGTALTPEPLLLPTRHDPLNVPVPNRQVVAPSDQRVEPPKKDPEPVAPRWSIQVDPPDDWLTV